MARQIWFLRHGDAEPHGSRPDFDRELTRRGAEQAVAAGKAMAVLGAEFELSLSSPRVRARQTAELAHSSLEGELTMHAPLGDAFDSREALTLAAALEPDGRMLLVGHEPTFSQTVFDLTGARVDFKKGGIAVVRINPTGAELLVLMRPRELAAIADSSAGV